MRRVVSGLPKSKIKRMFKDLKCSSEELSHHLIWLRTRHESKWGGGGLWGALTLSGAHWRARISSTRQRVAVSLISPAAELDAARTPGEVKMRGWKPSADWPRSRASPLLQSPDARARTPDGILLKWVSVDRRNSWTRLARCGSFKV